MTDPVETPPHAPLDEMLALTDVLVPNAGEAAVLVARPRSPDAGGAGSVQALADRAARSPEQLVAIDADLLVAVVPARAADTSPERPWPVRYLSLKVGEYIDRMPVTWVEGQVVQLNRRPGARTAYLTLRDTDADMSLSCSVRVLALDAMPTPLTQGSRVVIQTKAEYWAGRGSLTFDVRQIRPVGVGELLARIEYLKQNLAAEGLFDARRKRPLPFLPRRIGMICGRASAATRSPSVASA